MRSVDIGLDILGMFYITFNRGTKVAKDGRLPVLGHVELTRQVDGSIVANYLWRRRVGLLLLLKRSENGVVANAEHDVIGFDVYSRDILRASVVGLKDEPREELTCINKPTLGMQKV